MTGRVLASLAEIQALDIELDIAAGAGHPASALKAGAQSPHGVAVAGTDGYLFIGNGANRWERQFLGELAIDASWFSTWERLLAARRMEAERHGVKLLHFVAPEKQSVYADKRWPDGVDASRRPVRQLIERLAPPDLVYPVDELIAARAGMPAYFRHNSHWTASGCCLAVEQVLQALDLKVDVQRLGFALQRLVAPQDLTVHFFDPPPVESTALLAPAGEVAFDNQQLQTTGRHTGSIYGLANLHAPVPKSLIIFGDSFAFDAGLASALSAVFRHVVFVWSKNVVWDLVAKHEADIVLWESAERFIATPSQV